MRLSQLDALRGLAALSVFWCHAFQMMPQQPWALRMMDKTPAHSIHDGFGAVLLFFVLSGFVLNLKFVELETYPPHWIRTFIIRRIFRIYPAFLASVGFALMLRCWVFAPEAASAHSNLYQTIWAGPLPWSQLPRLLTLIAPNIQAGFVNNPIWSLVYEMRFSLFFPLIIVLVNRRRGWLVDAGILLATYTACFLLARAESFTYLPHFVLGAMCAKYFSVIEPRLAGFSRPAKLIFLLLALTIYETPSVLGWSAELASRQEEFVMKQIVGLGATGLILGCASFTRIGSLLNRGAFQFIGRTSYSFYLLHLPLLIAVGPLIFRVTHSYWMAWGGCLVLTYLLADLFFRFIESPGITLGNRVTKYWAPVLPTGPRKASSDAAA
jgi:peptidoglycan/LPS O-acetylase OafA/YrhL